MNRIKLELLTFYYHNKSIAWKLYLLNMFMYGIVAIGKYGRETGGF